MTNSTSNSSPRLGDDSDEKAGDIDEMSMRSVVDGNQHRGSTNSDKPFYAPPPAYKSKTSQIATSLNRMDDVEDEV